MMRRQQHPVWRRVIGLRASPFGRVTAGTAFGQLLMGLSLPLITMIYGAAEVGGFALALVYAQVFAIAMTGRIEQVIPRLDAGERWVPVRLATSTSALVAAIACGLSLVAEDAAIWILPVCVLSISIVVYNVCSMVVLAEQAYGLLVRIRIVNGVMTALGQVLGGLYLANTSMLVVTYAAGNVVAAAFALALVGRVRRRWSDASDNMRTVYRRERFGRFSFSVGGSAVMSSAALALPVIALDQLYGAAVTGSFFVARKVLMVPTQLVATTVSEVSYSMVARERPEHIQAYVKRWLFGLRYAAVGTLIVGVITAAVIELIVPEGYVDLWEVVALLTLPATAQLVATSLSNVLLAIRQERVRFFWNLGRLGGLALVFLGCNAVGASYLVTVGILAAYLTLTYGALFWLTAHFLARKVD